MGAIIKGVAGSARVPGGSPILPEINLSVYMYVKAMEYFTPVYICSVELCWGFFAPLVQGA